MHELSLACSLVEEVIRIRQREGAAGVSEIAVTVGALSGVDCDALEFAFPMAAEGTELDGAALAVTAVPARVFCRACNGEREAALPLALCGACGAADVDIVGGREFLIHSVKLHYDGSNDGAGSIAEGSTDV